MNQDKRCMMIALAGLLVMAAPLSTRARIAGPEAGSHTANPPLKAMPAAQRSAPAGGYDEYFASRIEAVPDNPDPRSASMYHIIFTPTKNQYNYMVEYAGKSAPWTLNRNACWHGDSAHRMSLEELKKINIATQVGESLTVNGDKDSVSGSGTVNAGVNQTRDIDVNRVYGTEFVRNPSIVYHEFHYRIVVTDTSQPGNPIAYKTPWAPGVGEDIKHWNWASDCSWVKQ